MAHRFVYMALLPLVALSMLCVLAALYQTNVNCLFRFLFPGAACPPSGAGGGTAATRLRTPDLSTALIWMERTASVSLSNWYNENVTTAASESLPVEWKESGRLVMPLHALYLLLSQRATQVAFGVNAAHSTPSPQDVSLVLVAALLLVAAPVTWRLSLQIARLIVSAAEEHESVLSAEKHTLLKSKSYRKKVIVVAAVFGFVLLWAGCVLPLFVVDAINLTTCALGAVCTYGAAYFYLGYLESLYNPSLFTMDAFDLRAPFMKEGEYSFYKQKVAAPFRRLCFAGALLALACLLQFQYVYLAPLFFAFLVGAFIQRGNVRVLVLKTDTKQKVAFSSYTDSVSKFAALCCFSVCTFGVLVLSTGAFWCGKQTLFSFLDVFSRPLSASGFHYSTAPYNLSCFQQNPASAAASGTAVCERPTPNVWALASRLFPEWLSIFAGFARHTELDAQKMLDVVCAVLIFFVNIINVFDLLLSDAFDAWPICFHSSEAFLKEKSTHLKLLAATDAADREKSAIWKNVTCVSCAEFVLTHCSVLCRLLLSFCASLLLLLPRTAPVYVTALLPPAALLVSLYGMNVTVRLMAPAVYQRASYKGVRVKRVDDADARFDSDFCVDSTAAVCDASDLLDSLHMMLACAACTDILVFPAVPTWARHVAQVALVAFLLLAWARILVSFFKNKFKLSGMEFWSYLWTYAVFLLLVWLSSSEKVSFIDQINGLGRYMVSPFRADASATPTTKAPGVPPPAMWVTLKTYLAAALLGQVILAQLMRHITRCGSFFGTYQELVVQGYKKR